jgi:hypothetical protein
MGTKPSFKCFPSSPERALRNIGSKVKIKSVAVLGQTTIVDFG